MSRKVQTRTTVKLAAALLTVVTITAHAHQGATGVVKERMDMMSEIGKAMKTIGQMVKGETAYDAPAARAAALVIQRHAENIPVTFPEGSTEKPSEALPAIWQNWEEFLAINSRMQSDAKTLAEIAAKSSGPEEIKIQFGAVGKSCSSCHEKFRLKKH